MPSWSKRALIRCRSSRAIAHCSIGSVLIITRTVTEPAASISTPVTSGSSMIRWPNSSSSRRSWATSVSTRFTRAEVLAVARR